MHVEEGDIVKVSLVASTYEGELTKICGGLRVSFELTSLWEVRQLLGKDVQHVMLSTS